MSIIINRFYDPKLGLAVKKFEELSNDNVTAISLYSQGNFKTLEKSQRHSIF